MHARVIGALRDPSVSHRKRVARDLVGKLGPRGIEPIRDLFVEETSPEVYKWLGMALAKSSANGIASVIQSKRQACADANAIDWLVAAEGAALPALAATSGSKLILSRDVRTQAEGAITMWGANRLSADNAQRLVALAAESDDAHLRRWALLALHAHLQQVPSAILLDNLASDAVLLREWSLHVLARYVPTEVRGRVMTLVEHPAAEHPRVLEWAVHAASAYDLHDVDLDRTLIDIHESGFDAEVGEACLGELGRRANPTALEYLEYICDGASNGYALGSILALRVPDGPPPPPRLVRAIAKACDRMEPTDPNLRYVLTRIPTPAETQRTVDQLLANPAARVLARARLIDYHEGHEVTNEHLRIGVVVALLEEYEYLADAIPLQVTDHALSGNTYYTATLGDTPETPFVLIVTLVGRKGVGFAVAAAERLLADHHPHVLVSLGISGQVHPKDGGLGDVVIGDSTTAYLENFKAVDEPEDRFRFEAGTETFRSDAELASRAAQLRIQDRARYDAWSETELAMRAPLAVPAPTVWHGPIAAGPGVVASEAFKAFVRSQNRGFLAVDMESSGVAQTSWLDLRRSKLLLVRGISDGANSSKDALDTNAKINYRQIAMRAASTYLVACVTSLRTRGKLP